MLRAVPSGVPTVWVRAVCALSRVDVTDVYWVWLSDSVAPCRYTDRGGGADNNHSTSSDGVQSSGMIVRHLWCVCGTVVGRLFDCHIHQALDRSALWVQSADSARWRSDGISLVTRGATASGGCSTST